MSVPLSEQMQIPSFLLTADDPIAPHMVVMWACFMNGDVVGALGEFNAIVQDFDPDESDVIANAERVAAAVTVGEEMEGWGS
jgi:hypothetical protein